MPTTISTTDDLPTPTLDFPIPAWQLATLETALPAWATATVVYRDGAGRVVGYGLADRATGAVSVSRDPGAGRLLAAFPPAACE